MVGTACCDSQMHERPEGPGWWLFTPAIELRASILAGALLLAGFVAGRLHWPILASSLSWASLLIGMLYGGRAAWHALKERKFDIDVLMVLAAGLAAGTGHADDGALLLFLFTLS